MRRRLSVAALGISASIGIGIAAASAALAPSALATDVTNPAQHPAPVTVTIDGQVYHDGLDTLPGYDDYACTAIPNVEYDFASNTVYYSDDEGNPLASAHWTEWSRISSYQTWVNQQAAASSSAPATGPTAARSSSAAATATSAAATNAPASSAPKGASSSSKSATSAPSPAKKRASSASEASARASVQPSTVAVSGAAVVASPTASGSTAASTRSSAPARHAAVAASSGGQPSSAAEFASTETTDTQVASQPSASLAGQSLAAAVTSSIGSGTGNTRLAGLGILAVLIAAGGLLLLGNVVRRKSFKRRVTGAHS